MTIHSGHPFAPGPEGRDPVRRLRGRLGGTVTLWTAGAGRDRVGLTVTSFMVAAGDPARVLVLLHSDSDLLERFEETGSAVACLLQWRHRELAEVFAGQFPAPGGPFRLDAWEDTAWGPRLTTAPTWMGLRLDPGTRREVGWSVLVEGIVEHVEVGDLDDPLVHRRGRYERLRG